MKAGLWTVFAAALAAALIVAGPAYAEEKTVLPDAAAAAVKKAMPDATASGVTIKSETPKLYNVSLRIKDKRAWVVVSDDGTVVTTETEVAQSALPEAAAKALTEAAKDGAVRRLKKVESTAEVKDGKLVKLDAPKISYSARIRKAGKLFMVEIAEDGTVTKTEEGAAPARAGAESAK